MNTVLIPQLRSDVAKIAKQQRIREYIWNMQFTLMPIYDTVSDPTRLALLLKMPAR